MKLEHVLRTVCAALVLSLATTGANVARGGALNLAVDSSQSSLSIGLNVLSGLLNLPLGNVTLSGAAPGIPGVLPPGSPNTTGFLGEVTKFGGIPGVLDDYGAGAFGTSLSISTGNIPFVGSFTAGLNVPGFQLDTGTFSPISAALNTATYNVGGLGLDITAGNFTYSGSGLLLGVLGSGTINFGINLLNGALAPNTQALLTLGPGPPSNQPATLRVPVNTSANLLGGLIGLSMQGTIVFTGVSVPEPGTWALLITGVVGFLPLARRRARRS